jgi:hypothetical protein
MKPINGKSYCHVPRALTWESRKEAFKDHNFFTRRATSDVVVLFQELGGPAKPTVCLYDILWKLNLLIANKCSLNRTESQKKKYS